MMVRVYLSAPRKSVWGVSVADPHVDYHRTMDNDKVNGTLQKLLALNDFRQIVESVY